MQLLNVFQLLDLEPPVTPAGSAHGRDMAVGACALGLKSPARAPTLQELKVQDG